MLPIRKLDRNSVPLERRYEKTENPNFVSDAGSLATCDDNYDSHEAVKDKKFLK